MKLSILLLVFGIVSASAFARLQKRGFQQTFNDQSSYQNFRCNDPAGCAQVGSGGYNPGSQRQGGNQNQGQPGSNGGQDFGGQNSGGQNFGGQNQNNGKLNGFDITDNTGHPQGQNGAGSVTTNRNGPGQGTVTQFYDGNAVANNHAYKREIQEKEQSAENLKITKREAAPGFTQTFNGNAMANNYECNARGTCNRGTFNTQYDQTYNGQASANNYDQGRKKRSQENKFYLAFSKLNKREARPGFSQTFNGNTRANNYECNSQGTCNTGTFNTQYDQTYNGQSSANNYDQGRKKRSDTQQINKFYLALSKLSKREARPGFAQTFNGNSRANNYECNVAGTCQSGSFNTQYRQTYNGQAHANNYDNSGKK